MEVEVRGESALLCGAVFSPSPRVMVAASSSTFFSRHRDMTASHD